MDIFEPRNELNHITLIFSKTQRFLKIFNCIIESQVLSQLFDKYRIDADTYYLEDVTIQYPDKSRQYFAYYKDTLTPIHIRLEQDELMEIE